MASSDSHGRIKLWDLASGKLLAAASRDGTVGLWRVAGDRIEQLVTFRFGGTPVMGVRFDRDAARLAVLLERENALRLVHLDCLHRRLAETGLDW